MSQNYKGKTACCIEMLQILNTGKIYNTTQLANYLEINPRNIPEYVKELREVSMGSKGGFYIENIPGRYGGYKLNGKAIIPPLQFTNEESKSIDEALVFLQNRNDFPNKKYFVKAISKMYSSIAKNIFTKDISIINRYPLTMSQEEIDYRYNIIDKAISENKAIKIKYLSQKNVIKKHIFHPYNLFMYNNAWFVIGWCETWNNVGYFKLNRINELNMINKTFSIYKYYNEADYIDEYGFKRNGEWYHIEFIAKGIYASLVKERIYGKNQEVIPLNEDETLVKVDMQNEESILTFILGFNTKIEVLKPKWLIDKLINYSQFISNLYKNNGKE